MSLILDILLPILVGFSILAMLIFLVRAFRSRHKSSRQAYDVGRQEAHRTSRLNIIRAAIFLLLAFILLAIMGISPILIQSSVEPTTAPRPQETVAPSRAATLVPTATEVTSTVEPSPTSPSPTATSTPPPTSTSTPQPLTATVSSGVGVWLRESPGTETEQLEWLLEGTVLIVLAGQQTSEDLLWQQVETEEGRVGWVAADFIVINE